MSLMKRRIVYLLPFVILIIIILFVDNFYFKHRLHLGIYSKNIHIGGKRIEEVEQTLQHSTVIMVAPQGQAITLSLSELGIIPDAHSMFIEGYQLSRNKSRLQSYLTRYNIMRNKAHIPLRFELDQEQLHQGIALLEKTISRDPSDAYFEFSADGQHVRVVPEETGYRLNREKYLEQLLKVLEQPQTTEPVVVPAKELQAQVISSFLEKQGIEARLSSFTTTFDPANEDRVHNMSLATSIVNNYVLAPGEVFSLNAMLGDSTPEKGYKKAPIIVGGNLVPGFGGGLCQVSTTLYNAALLADLDVLERHNHQLAIPYIAPGRDATISYGTKDLKFRNNKAHHVLITASVKGHEIIFNLYGTPTKQTVKIETQIINVFLPPMRYEVAPELSANEEELAEGEPGYLVEVWKAVYEGEKIMSKKKISTDRYMPYPTVVKRGIRQP